MVPRYTVMESRLWGPECPSYLTQQIPDRTKATEATMRHTPAVTTERNKKARE